ncbi:MAG: hypothetical protein RMK29_21490 [Myxococcales bacterium]|nr:hypothetical protein [Myxococcota bacterium]MDW8284286.1 hypothetical protein [Myxococcales bacterium]
METCLEATTLLCEAAYQRDKSTSLGEDRQLVTVADEVRQPKETQERVV